MRSIGVLSKETAAAGRLCLSHKGRGKKLPPGLDDDLGVGFRIGQISERLRDAGDANGRGHERSGVDLERFTF